MDLLAFVDLYPKEHLGFDTYPLAFVIILVAMLFRGALSTSLTGMMYSGLM